MPYIFPFPSTKAMMPHKRQIAQNEFLLIRAFGFPPIKFPVFFVWVKIESSRNLFHAARLPMPIGRSPRPKREFIEKCQIPDHHPSRIITGFFGVDPIISLSPTKNTCCIFPTPSISLLSSSTPFSGVVLFFIVQHISGHSSFLLYHSPSVLYTFAYPSLKIASQT